MIRSQFLSIALSISFALTAQLVSGQAPQSAPLPDVASSSTATIDTIGSELYAGSGTTGMVLVVVQDNRTYFRSYGETAPGSHQAPDQDSLLRLCSLTKIFTTDLLTKLVADKTVTLDDPLQKYALTGRVVPKRVKPITLLDLATHTAGLPRELGWAPRDTPHFTYPDYKTRWQWLPQQHLRSVPGNAALYSNIGFDLLADALQGATHRQYAAVLSEKTLIPLRMWNTTYFPTFEQCSRLLEGAYKQGACTVTEQTAGSSGLYSTANDMTIWLRYLLRLDNPGATGQNPAAQAIYVDPAKLTRNQGLSHAGEPTGVGLGWIHILPTDSESTIVEKTGGGAGFQTYIAINHARRTAVFVAATDGRATAHQNLFDATNNLLLQVAGLPPLPPPPIVKAHARHRAATPHKSGVKHKAVTKPGSAAKHKPVQRNRKHAR
jgi:Beta-lactamase class C and other penicillin binding proteins